MASEAEMAGAEEDKKINEKISQKKTISRFFFFYFTYLTIKPRGNLPAPRELNVKKRQIPRQESDSAT